MKGCKQSEKRGVWKIKEGRKAVWQGIEMEGSCVVQDVMEGKV